MRWELFIGIVKRCDKRNLTELEKRVHNKITQSDIDETRVSFENDGGNCASDWMALLRFREKKGKKGKKGGRREGREGKKSDDREHNCDIFDEFKGKRKVSEM